MLLGPSRVGKGAWGRSWLLGLAPHKYCRRQHLQTAVLALRRRGGQQEGRWHAKLLVGKWEKACCIDEIILITAMGMTEACRLAICSTGAVQQGRGGKCCCRLTGVVDHCFSVTPSSFPLLYCTSRLER
jgi:hypothetical protein